MFVFQKMQNPVITQLEWITEHLKFRKFYVPDGSAMPELPVGNQPNARLLFVFEGKKPELMSLNGRIETVQLETGDVYLLGKNIWEYGNMNCTHKLFCIVARAGYLRISSYDTQNGCDVRDVFKNNLFHHTGTPPPESLLSIFSALEHCDAPDAVPDLLRAALKITLFECRKPCRPLSKALMTFESVRNYLDRHYSSPVTRESVAEAFGMNPSYLSQLFSRFERKRFQDYLGEQRISHAKFLLAGTKLTIKEIAELCGFGNDVYFIRRFRELCGISPGRYRLIRKNNVKK